MTISCSSEMHSILSTVPSTEIAKVLALVYHIRGLANRLCILKDRVGI